MLDVPGAGPAVGLLGAARARPGRPLLALACDLPDVPEAFLAHLASIEGFDWVVPESARGLEPLCALYGPAALAALEFRVARGRFALYELAGEAGLRIRHLVPSEVSAFGAARDIFWNVNRAEDLERPPVERREISPGPGRSSS